MEAYAGKSFQMQIIFNIFPCISLHFKLAPVQYWEYEYGLLHFDFNILLIALQAKRVCCAFLNIILIKNIAV